MDCNKVKKHLAQYIENDLKKDVQDIINKHLLSCKECRAELNFLKQYKKEMASLKGIKAPADFLEQLNSRIDKSSYFSRIIHTLFFPLKIKLPIEAIGMAGVVLIVLLFYPAEKVDNVHFAKGELKREAADTTDIRIAKTDKFAGKMLPGSEQRENMQVSEMAKRKSAIIRDEVAAIYQVALLIKEDEVYKSAEVKAEDSAPQSAMPAERSAAPAAAGTDKMKESASGIAKEKDIVRESEDKKAGEKEIALSSNALKARDAKAEKIAKVAVDQRNRSAAVDNSIYQIKNFAESIDGKIIAEEQDKNGVQNVLVELPAKNKKEFLSRLNEIGQVKKQSARHDKMEKSARVKVNIQIMQK